jgi:hypothetical protein
VIVTGGQSIVVSKVWFVNEVLYVPSTYQILIVSFGCIS